MREGPKATPPPVVDKAEGLVKQIREYELLTPLYGGGVVPGKVDHVTPISGKAVRGHLRFWWRAARAGRFKGELERLQRAEGTLWGAASTASSSRPSEVQLHVEIINRGQPLDVRHRGQSMEIGSVRSPYSYVAFPLRDTGNKVVSGIRFRLHLTFSEKHQAEVEAALWAWETFGGVGARTRRGFGALKLLSVDGQAVRHPDTSLAASDQIIAKFREHVRARGVPDDVPYLLLHMAVSETEYPDGMKAWEALFGALQAYRQDRDGRYGPSLWPEPNAIRSLTQGRKAGERPLIQKFPRAKFGLPVIFHFKDKGEPEQTTLVRRDSDRHTSPLILRPLPLSRGRAVGLAMVLKNSEVPDDLVLQGDRRDYPVRSDLTPEEADLIPATDGEVDLLRHFVTAIVVKL